MKHYPLFVLVFSLIVLLTHKPYIEPVKVIAEPVVLTQKEQIVADVVHEELKWPKYTIRNGLDGARKPIPKVTGKNKEERIKEILAKSNMAHTYQIWIDYGKQYKIDPTFAIAIAWSESHIGLALTTSHNYCNVWNTDSGRRTEIEMQREWIRRCFSAFHGTYLKWYNQIKYLSGEGRTRAKLNGCVGKWDYCFATSAHHWETNVVNMMSVINDTQIDGEYNFRSNF